MALFVAEPFSAKQPVAVPGQSLHRVGKVPALNALAPTQKEPPFAVSQLLVLTLFVVATAMALKRFRPEVTGSSTPPLSQKGEKRAA